MHTKRPRAGRTDEHRTRRRKQGADQRASTFAGLAGRAGTWAWLVGGGVSLVLFALVAAQLDAAAFAAASGTFWLLFAAGVALFVVEYFVSAARMRWMAGDAHGFRAAMQVTAWHGIWLVALPMRLGELVAAAAIQHVYGWSFATALACVAVQRLLDMAAVATLLLLALPAVFGAYDEQRAALAVLGPMALLLALVSFAAVATSHIWLRAVSARILSSGFPLGQRRRLLQPLARVRRWVAHIQRRRMLHRCVLLTVLSWLATVAGFWVLGRAAGLHIAPFEFGFAAAASILFGSLPAPTVGSFGMLEAGFTGIVAWLGAPIATAAAAALAIRFASLAATGAFWLLAVGPTAMRSRGMAGQ